MTTRTSADHSVIKNFVDIGATALSTRTSQTFSDNEAFEIFVLRPCPIFCADQSFAPSDIHPTDIYIMWIYIIKVKLKFTIMALNLVDSRIM
jgi:hypothetical protein